MCKNNKKAFTMVELVFVIVIIGILSAIAVPKFSATRDDAILTKAATTVAAIRNSISTERQKRILRGNFTPITDLGLTAGANQDIFDFFDGNNSLPVLEYSLRSCADANARGCWIEQAGSIYRFRFPHNATNVDFNITNSRFDCVAATAQADCDLLTQ
jgi:general secretion pathway protein G